MTSKFKQKDDNLVNVYLASSADNKFLISTIGSLLMASIDDIKITSLWHELDPMVDITKLAEMDLDNGIKKSDIVIVFYPYGEQGTITELTAAFYTGKRIIYCRSDNASHKDPMITGLFYKNSSKCYIASTIDDLFYILIKFKDTLLLEKGEH